MDKLAQDAKAQIDKARGQITDYTKGVDADIKKDAEEWIAEETKTTLLKVGRMDLKVRRCVNLGKIFREDNSGKERRAAKRLKGVALKLLRYNQQVRLASTPNAYFEMVDTKSLGHVDEDEWCDFFD